MTNPQDFRPSESVTPLKRRAQDGIVYERTGEKRQPEPGELIWHDGLQIAPYPYDPKRDSLLVTPIWIVSEDQNWQPPVIQSGPQNEIDRLIQEVEIVRETGSDYGRLIALGSLHQAKELERIANALDSLCTVRFIPDGSRGTGSREAGIETPAGDVIWKSWVCLMCTAGEHSRCNATRSIAAPEIACQCPVCWQAPRLLPPLEGPYYGPLHLFEGMEDNHFCTKCGAGRLHAIHQG